MGAGAPSRAAQSACIRARVTAIAAQIYLKDLGSSNGTFMNGVAVKGAQLLDDGDTIDFGWRDEDSLALPEA